MECFQTAILAPHPPAPSTSFHNFTQGFCICPWAIIDRVHAGPCNTRDGDSTASETPERRAIRAPPTSRHGGASRWERQTGEPGDATQIRAALSEGRGGRLPARGSGFPTTCCLVLNKRWHVVRRHPTPRLKGCSPRGVHSTPGLTFSGNS